MKKVDKRQLNVFLLCLISLVILVVTGYCLITSFRQVQSGNIETTPEVAIQELTQFCQASDYQAVALASAKETNGKVTLVDKVDLQTHQEKRTTFIESAKDFCLSIYLLSEIEKKKIDSNTWDYHYFKRNISGEIDRSDQYRFVFVEQKWRPILSLRVLFGF